MTKLKQFGNEFDVLYSRESSPWTGEVQGLTAVEGTLFLSHYGQE